MNGRRTFLSTTLKAAGGFARGPALVRQDRARPGIPYGAVSGDVTRDRLELQRSPRTHAGGMGDDRRDDSR